MKEMRNGMEKEEDTQGVLSLGYPMPFPIRHAAENCRVCEHRTLRLFCNLGEEALRRFEAIGTLLSLPGRSVVFTESQRVSNVFVVCSGQLKLSATSREGRTMILRLAGPGDVLGLSAALSETAHEVTAETIEPTQLKAIRKADFVQIFDEFAEVGQKSAKVVAKEYREVYLDARRLAISGSAAGKLAQLLLEWARAASCGRAELRLTMALTHEELGNMSGISRETVTRLLKQFERDRLIERRGSALVLSNALGLEALVL